MNLAAFILKQVAERAVEDPRNAALEGGGMLARVESPSRRFDSHQFHRQVRHEGVEYSHSVGSATDARHHAGWRPTGRLEHLGLCFASDD